MVTFYLHQNCNILKSHLYPEELQWDPYDLDYTKKEPLMLDFKGQVVANTWVMTYQIFIGAIL